MAVTVSFVSLLGLLLVLGLTISVAYSQGSGTGIPVDLSGVYNLDGISTAQRPGDGGFDGNFNYAAETLPPAGLVELSDVTFQFPSSRDGVPNFVVPAGQNLPVPPGRYHAIALLESSVFGSSDVDLTFHYDSGPPQTRRIVFSDWCVPPSESEIVAVQADYRHDYSGRTGPAPAIFMQLVPVDPTRTLRAIQLGNAKNARIAALTLIDSADSLRPELRIQLFARQNPLLGQLLSRWAATRTLATWAMPGNPEVLPNILAINQAFASLRSDYTADDLAEIQARVEAFETWVRPLLHEPGTTAANHDVWLVGSSHLDAAWLWRREETIEKARATYSQALSHLVLNPTMKVAFSSPQYYQWMEEKYPEIFHHIQEYVREGRWILVGGSWVESDGNLPDGESLIRQRLYGQRYFLAKFGKLAEVEWLPDTFGFTWQLPQIMRKSGQKYFVTSKLFWNDTNRFPFNAFRWRSPDGSEVLAYLGRLEHDFSVERLTTRRFQQEITPWQLLVKPVDVSVVFDSSNFNRRHILEITVNNDWKGSAPYGPVLLYYGKGDGGHGPVAAEVAAAAAANRLGIAHDGDPAAFFHGLEEAAAGRLPIWNDELYLEYHQGTYTSQAAVKLANRRLEQLLVEAEKWATLSMLYTGRPYPKEQLDEAWKLLLFNQFHDILPGSSISEVYADAAKDYDRAFTLANDVLAQSVRALGQRMIATTPRPAAVPASAHPVVLFNALSWERNDIARVPLSGLGLATPTAEVIVYGPDGRRVPAQIVEEEGFGPKDKDDSGRQLIFPAKVPGSGMAVYWLAPVATGERSPTARQKVPVPIELPCTIENRWYRLTIDAQGALAELYDKEAGRAVLKGPGNLLQAFVDKPDQWDAWNIDRDYERKPLTVGTPTRVELVEDGAVRTVIRYTRRLGSSHLVQEVRLYHQRKEVEFATIVDWQERQTLLKMAFPLAVESDALVTEIPYGIYQRPTRPKTAMERAKFEFPAGKWVAMDDGEFQVTLVNDSKYGFDLNGSTVRMTLLKGAIWPDPNADKGRHVIRYAITSGTGDWKSAASWQRGYEYNQPLVTWLPDAGLDDGLPGEDLVESWLIPPAVQLMSPARSAEVTPDEPAEALPAMGFVPGMEDGSIGYIQVDDPDQHVALTAVKLAEDSNGIVLRVVEMTGQGGRVAIRFSRPVARAESIDFLEFGLWGPQPRVEGATVYTELKPFEIQALRVEWDRRVAGWDY